MGMAIQPSPAPQGNLLALPDGTELVGDYRIKRVLGAGGFGITYLADERALARLVTIKEYFPAEFAVRRVTRDASPRSQECVEDYKWGLERFIEEAQTLARFIHPNIVRVYRYFRANNTGYMVLHFEEGGSFKAWLKGLKRAPRQPELDKILAAPARGAGDGARRRLPAPRYRPRQHHHPQGRVARPDRLRLGTRRDRLAFQDRERPRQARLQPLRAIRHHLAPTGTVDGHLRARRDPLPRGHGQASAGCALAHGQRRVRPGQGGGAQLLPPRFPGGDRQGAAARDR